MEKRLSAYEAWYNAQYIIGKTAVLDYILDRIVELSKKGIIHVSWNMGYCQPPETPILELFRNKEVQEYVIEILVNLGYIVDFEEGIYGKLDISWGPDQPPNPL